MKTKFYIIFALFIAVLFSSDVKAGTWDPNLGGDGDSNYTQGCSGRDSCWSDSYWGYRVSLVDKYGKRISTPTKGTSISADYMNNIPSGVYSIQGKYNRFEVLGGSPNTFTSGNFLYYHTGINDYYNIGKNNTVENYFNSILRVNSTDPKDDDSTEESLLATMNVTKKDAEALCAPNQTGARTELYLLIEPLFVIRGGSTAYIGTGTEIAKLIYANNYTWIKSIVYRGTIGLSIITPNPIPGSPIINVNSFISGSSSPDVNKVLYASGTNIYGYAMGLYSFNKYIDCTTPPPDPDPTPDPGPEPSPPPDLCTFDLDVDITNDCDEGTIGHVNDINNWACIFESRNSTVAKIKNHFYEWENRYCSVFCRESITYEFPNRNMSVFAGRRFTVGYSGFTPTLSPVAFTGRSECRTTSTTGSIRWDLFKTDWANANIQVKNTWDAYQIEIKKDDGIAAYIQSPTKNCANYCDNNVHGLECCKSATYHPPVTCAPGAINCTPKSGYYSCNTKDTPYDHGYTRKPTEQTYINTDNVTLKINTNSWCTSCGNSFTSTKCTPDTTYTASTRASYQSALATRDGYLRTLKECNNFQRTYNDFKPVTFFEYEEERYGGETYQLEDNLEIRAQTNFFYGSNYASRTWNTSSYVGNSNEFIYDYTNTGRTDVIAKWVCDTLRQKCYSVNETYPINTWIKQFTTKEFDYELPNNIYRFIDKPSGESYHYSPGPNSYDIGYSNLPVHYSRAPGVYDFSIDYKTFGPNHKFNKYIFDGEYIGISFGQDLGIYAYLWNNSTLNRLINDCEQGGHHLGHSFVSQIGSRLGEFIDSGCAQTYGCTKSGSLVQCNRYQDTYGNWRNVSSSSQYYTTYNQLRACIQSKVVSTTGSIAFNEDTKYECQYNVQNRVMCEPENCDEQVGLSAIYREINLSDPFPGLDGTGRTPGNNWNLSYFIDTYITNNRGVKTDSVYFERDPMYKITLTPAIIKTIRQYNQQQIRVDDGYADFKMSCLDNGTRCLSGFIRESEFKNLFTGCGIKGRTIGNKPCAANEGW